MIISSVASNILLQSSDFAFVALLICGRKLLRY